MFDLGWQEFIIIAFVLVMVVGPKDLPRVLKGITKLTSQARRMAREFTRTLEEAAADSEIDEIKKTMQAIKSEHLEQLPELVDQNNIMAEFDNVKSESQQTIEDAKKMASKDTSISQKNQAATKNKSKTPQNISKKNISKKEA